MILYVCLFLLLILFIQYTNFYNRQVKKIDNKIPGPPTLPFIGNAHFVMGNSAEFFNSVNALAKVYGTRCRAFVGNQLFLFLHDVKDIEFVLTSNELITKSSDYEFFRPWLGTGLPIGTGEKWRKHRKIVTPSFHIKILEKFIQVFDTQSDILIKKLSTHVDGKSFELFQYITPYTLDIICETAMGVSIGAQNHPDSEYFHAIEDVCRIMVGRIRSIVKRSDFLFKFTSDYWKQRKAIKILHSMTYKTIKERRHILEQEKVNLNSYTDDDETVLGKKRKLTLLDMLLLSKVDGKPLTDVEIREETDSFLFGGHDTVCSAIAFTLYLISHHPEIQQKIFEEQKDIFGDNFDRSTLYKDLQDMKYMELVIKEALRLYPSGPIITRKTNKDVNINDMFVPADTTLVILIYNLHRNPEVFPDPDKFVPERFLPDQVSKRSPFSTVPFSAGPRNCIGQKFGMLEMKLSISKIIRNYELLPSYKKFTLTADAILKTVEGINLKLTKRLI